LAVRVVDGEGLEIAGLEREPDAGLVPELRLDAGACHEQTYPLDDWITAASPGTHLIECRIELEVARQSLRAPRGRAEPERVAVTDTVSLELQEPGS
jgi:hypothetical protein